MKHEVVTLKGLSVKRIAAVAAGAAMIAATAAAVTVDSAGLSNYQFVSNGAPSVKVVVGAKAAASDGVAAANIAAMIGNLAYKTNAVTVLPGGACTGAATSGNVSGVGQCVSNVTGKSVTLEAKTDVVSPSQTYELKTYVYEALGGANGQVLEASAPRFEESPTGYYKVDGYTTAVLANADVTDAQASKTYKEVEEVYLKTSPRYDTTSKKVKAQNVDIYYNVTFPVTALPYSTGLDPGTVSSGETAKSVLTARHRVPIKFLGASWIVTELNINGSATTNSVKLAKESVYNAAMKIGDNLTVGDYTVKLGDVQPASGSATLGSATYQVYDKNGNLVETKLVNEQTDSDKGTSGIIVHPYTIFAGTYARDAYAETAVYSNVLNLQDGKRVDSSTNKDWSVTLHTTNAGGAANADSLTAIQLHSDVSQTLLPGDSVNIIPDPVALKFTYNGPKDVSTDNLRLTPLKQQSFTIGNSASTLNVVKVESSVDTAFQFSGVMFDGSSKTVKTGTIYLVVDDTNANFKKILVKDPDGSKYNYTAASGTGSLSYQYKSTETAATVSWSNVTNAGAVSDTVFLNITEWYDKSATLAGKWQFQLNNTRGTSGSANFVTTSGVTQYFNNSAAVNTAVEEKYVSLRGATLTTLGTSGVALAYPLLLREASYYLQTTGATTTTAGTQSVIIKEGEKGSLGGLDITVKSVAATAAPCTVTTSSGRPLDCTACSVDPATLTPSISSAATVTPLDTSANRLVLLDSDAADVSQAILVGGPIVNTITKNVLPAEVQLKAAGDAVVKVVGTKVVVAGYTAADTTAASSELIKFLASRRA